MGVESEEEDEILRIYIVLNNSLDRCIFANRKSILLGVSKKRFTSYRGHEEFKHTNDYTEITL